MTKVESAYKKKLRVLMTKLRVLMTKVKSANDES